MLPLNDLSRMKGRMSGLGSMSSAPRRSFLFAVLTLGLGAGCRPTKQESLREISAIEELLTESADTLRKVDDPLGYVVAYLTIALPQARTRQEGIIRALHARSSDPLLQQSFSINDSAEKRLTVLALLESARDDAAKAHEFIEANEVKEVLSRLGAISRKIHLLGRKIAVARKSGSTAGLRD